MAHHGSRATLHSLSHPSSPLYTDSIQGVHAVWGKLRASIFAEVDRFRPQHVFITGHSLGGALTHLASFAIARRYPSTRIDAVAFGSIMIGDEAFMREIKVGGSAALLRQVVTDKSRLHSQMLSC